MVRNYEQQFFIFEVEMKADCPSMLLAEVRVHKASMVDVRD